MTELRLRVLQLLKERQRRRTDLATAGEIAGALGAPLQNVVVTLRSCEAMGMVEVAQRFGMRDEDMPICLKPPAYVYLEAQLNPGQRSGD